jgi:hypothetical protein
VVRKLISVPHWARLPKSKNCLYIALYFRQFFTYGFDKKRLISQDIQDSLCKNPTEVTLIKFFDTKRLCHLGHNWHLKGQCREIFCFWFFS